MKKLLWLVALAALMPACEHCQVIVDHTDLTAEGDPYRVHQRCEKDGVVTKDVDLCWSHSKPDTKNMPAACLPK